MMLKHARKKDVIVVRLEGELDQLAESIWNSLNCDNKVSLYVSTVELETGKRETVIYNKHLGGKAE